MQLWRDVLKRSFTDAPSGDIGRPVNPGARV